MLNYIILLFAVAICIGVVSLVYTVILPFEPIGNKWYQFLKKITRGNPYLFKPLIDCSRCFAGQVALWSYLFTFLHIRINLPRRVSFQFVEQLGHSYNLPAHIFFVCASIMFADIFIYYYNKR